MMDFWVEKAKHKLIRAQCEELRKDRQKAKQYKLVIRRLRENIQRMKREYFELKGDRKILLREISQIHGDTSHVMNYKKRLTDKLACVEIRAEDIDEVISEMREELKLVNKVSFLV